MLASIQRAFRPNSTVILPHDDQCSFCATKAIYAQRANNILNTLTKRLSTAERQGYRASLCTLKELPKSRRHASFYIPDDSDSDTPLAVFCAHSRAKGLTGNNGNINSYIKPESFWTRDVSKGQHILVGGDQRRKSAFGTLGINFVRNTSAGDNYLSEMDLLCDQELSGDSVNYESSTYLSYNKSATLGGNLEYIPQEIHTDSDSEVSNLLETVGDSPQLPRFPFALSPAGAFSPALSPIWALWPKTITATLSRVLAMILIRARVTALSQCNLSPS